MNAVSREADRVAENVYLKLFARIAQVIGTGLVLPFALWVLIGAASELRGLREFQLVANTTLESLKENQQRNDQSIGGLTERVRNQEETTRGLQSSQERLESDVDEILTILRNSPSLQGGSPR